MFLINDLKNIVDNRIIIIFFIISFFLIFKNSKDLKKNNLKRDYIIVRTTGIIYGLLAIMAAVLINR